jgi:hypothetical protein
MENTKTLMLTILIPCRPDMPEHVHHFIRQNLTAHIEQEFLAEWDPTWVEPAWEGPPVTGSPAILSQLIDTVIHKVPGQ